MTLAHELAALPPCAPPGRVASDGGATNTALVHGVSARIRAVAAHLDRVSRVDDAAQLDGISARLRAVAPSLDGSSAQGKLRAAWAAHVVGDLVRGGCAYNQCSV